VKLTKTDLLQLITGIFVGCLIISNILASKTFTLYGTIILPTAVIIFPIIYIINDVMAEIYGYAKARRVILLGFAINLLAVVAYNIAIKLPAPIFATDTSNAFALILNNSGRILVASFLAYLIGSLVNAKLMVYMKARLEKYLMLRCMSSTLLGEGLDAMIFITGAFYGLMPNNILLGMVIAQAAVKTLYELAVYPLTRMFILKLRTLEE